MGDEKGILTKFAAVFSLPRIYGGVISLLAWEKREGAV